MSYEDDGQQSEDHRLALLSLFQAIMSGSREIILISLRVPSTMAL